MMIICVCVCGGGGGHPSRRFQHWVPSVGSSAHTLILAGTRMGRNAVWKTVLFFFLSFLLVIVQLFFLRKQRCGFLFK